MKISDIVLQLFENSISRYISEEDLENQQRLMLYLISEYVGRLKELADNKVSTLLHINIFSLVLNNAFIDRKKDANLAALIVKCGEETLGLLHRTEKLLTSDKKCV